MNQLDSSNRSLAQHPFWKGLPAKHWPLIRDLAVPEVFQAGQEICRISLPASHFYLLTEGRVELEAPYVPGEGFIEVETLEAPAALGWSWLFPPFRWHFTAKAKEFTSAYVFDAARLRRIAEQNTDFGYDLSKRVGGVMLERLQATRVRLLGICEAVAL